MALRDDEPFQTLPTDSTHYLGSYPVLLKLLRVKAGEFITKVRAGEAPDAAARPIAQFLARVLLGGDPDYTAVDGWNTPGAIDLAIYRAMDLDDNSPDEVMEHWAVAYLSEVLAVMNYSTEPGVTDEQWQWQLQDVYDRYTKLALGIAEPEADESDG